MSKQKNDILDVIFKNPDIKYGLKIFDRKHFDKLQFTEEKGKHLVKCVKRQRFVPAKPEEIIRQLFIHKLMDDYGYPLERIEVEKEVWFGSGVSEKRADIAVLHKDKEHLYIIVETKKPNRRNGEQQLKSYCNAEGSPLGAWTNGQDLLILHREEPNVFVAISDIPTIDQTLNDVLKEKKTITQLSGKFHLKEIILSLEDMVLANAGVDAFEEVFKLIYAKLYDEWSAKKKSDKTVNFRIVGESPSELYEKINALFKSACNQWRDVFRPMDKIELAPSHLKTCVSYLHCTSSAKVAVFKGVN